MVMTEWDRVKRIKDFDQGKADRGEYTPEQLEDFASAILYEDRADTKKVISDIQTEILVELEKGESYPALIADQCDLSSEAVSANMKKMYAKGWITKGKKEKGIQYWAVIEGDLPDFDNTNWMKEADLKDRRRVEIYSVSGDIDPSHSDGDFWRTHPEGREFRTPEERKANPRLSFYK